MKRQYSILFLAGMFALGACETDNKKYHAENYVMPQVEQPSAGTDVTLTEETGNDTLFINWKPASYGFPGAVTYSVEIAKAGTHFASPVKIAETKETETGVVYSALNNSLLIAGLVPETTEKVELRVNASINGNIEMLNSEPIEMNITPYDVVVTYPILFVPGSYQSWNPKDSLTIVTSLKADDVYEGYFYFPANTEFKFTKQPDWNPVNWGSGGNNVLKPDGSNISVSTAGFYKVVANISKLTYSITSVTWSFQGTATGNTPVSLAYNPATQTLQATTSLSAGSFLFKENGAGNRTLGLYFGNQLKDDGTPVPVNNAGSYTITLDLRKYPYTWMLQ